MEWIHLTPRLAFYSLMMVKNTIMDEREKKDIKAIQMRPFHLEEKSFALVNYDTWRPFHQISDIGYRFFFSFY